MKKETVLEDFHGVKVADPYRWLEDPNSDKSIAWTREQQQKYTDYKSELAKEIMKQDRHQLEKLFHYDKLFVPKRVNGKLFYQKGTELQNQASLYIQHENGGEEILIDPNTFSTDGTVALTNYFISPDANYIVYGVSKHGSDWQEFRILNVKSKQVLPETIEYIKFTTVAWLPDSSGFYYGRFVAPEEAQDDNQLHNRLYFHKLHTEQQKDQFVFEHPDNQELVSYPFTSDDDQYICLQLNEGTKNENRLYLRNLDSDQEFHFLLDQQDAHYSYITNKGHLFYFHTDLDNPKGKIIAIDARKPERDNWKTIVPEQENVMEYVRYVGNKFIIIFTHHAHHQLHVYNEDGTYAYEWKLPFIGSINGLTINKEENECFLSITSFLEATSIYHVKIDDTELTAFASAQIAIDTNTYTTEQVFYTSKDRTKVPMFLTYRKDLQKNGNNPVILFGYGGFNITVSPTFNPAIVHWIEQGGIYAVANIRGGSEYGEAWHRDGMLENKQNVFDDFISAGEWLIQQNYTNTEKLSIMGGSNGGLLVAACMVQRPDLFGAVICRVPVIDMLRYHLFTLGKYWINEYGDPGDPEHFSFLYNYSPLHNVKEGEVYPPVLIATAESDDRVVPAHAKKFTATLQEKADPVSKVILRVEGKAGHGHGKPTNKIIDEWVDFYAFLRNELKLEK